jgi:hypothetical protein
MMRIKGLMMRWKSKSRKHGDAAKRVLTLLI